MAVKVITRSDKRKRIIRTKVYAGSSSMSRAARLTHGIKNRKDGN